MAHLPCLIWHTSLMCPNVAAAARRHRGARGAALQGGVQASHLRAAGARQIREGGSCANFGRVVCHSREEELQIREGMRQIREGRAPD
eukprot:4835645-Prymnesium_polylepis.1